MKRLAARDDESGRKERLQKNLANKFEVDINCIFSSEGAPLCAAHLHGNVG